MDNSKKVDFFNLICSALDYWDLNRLEGLILFHKRRALRAEIDDGRIQMPLQSEVDLALVNRDKIAAIKAYNIRTRQGLKVSKHVIEHFIMTGGVL